MVAKGKRTRATTVDGKFTHGVLEPAEPIDLDEGQRVRITILPMPKGSPSRSLRGRFPELRALSEEDIGEAIQQVEKGARHQLDLLSDENA